MASLRDVSRFLAVRIHPRSACTSFNSPGSHDMVSAMGRQQTAQSSIVV
jgi:hypothetical protein